MKKILILLIIAAFIVLSIHLYFNSSPSDITEAVFTIKYGDTIRGTANKLKNNNYIKNSSYFVFLSYLTHRKYIKAGRYRIFPGMSCTEILKKITRGDVITRQVTIPEGFNLYQIAQRLDANDVTDSGKFLYYACNSGYLNSIKIYSSSAEGYLFPDTYVFPERSDPRDIIIFMYNKMKRVLLSLDKDDITDMHLDMKKLLILASLVEKEARIPSERKYISSVFHNRIKYNMRLDCDPTVRYAVKKFKGRITYRDLAYDSPFNTYTRKGLPPTPICSPGKASIKATIYPSDTSYLFFVARNDGSHYFSKTLKQHNKAVRYYQKNEKNEFIDMQRLAD